MKYYIIIINIISFILYALDKKKAQHHHRRISEYRLLSMSILGGSGGSILGMIIFKHKTKQKKFWFINIIFLIIWITGLLQK